MRLTLENRTQLQCRIAFSERIVCGTHRFNQCRPRIYQTYLQPFDIFGSFLFHRFEDRTHHTYLKQKFHTSMDITFTCKQSEKRAYVFLCHSFIQFCRLILLCKFREQLNEKYECETHRLQSEYLCCLPILLCPFCPILLSSLLHFAYREIIVQQNLYLLNAKRMNSCTHTHVVFTFLSQANKRFLFTELVPLGSRLNGMMRTCRCQ